MKYNTLWLSAHAATVRAFEKPLSWLTKKTAKSWDEPRFTFVRSTMTIELRANNPEARMTKLMQIAASCRTLDQLANCRVWIKGLSERGGLARSEIDRLLGALEANEFWLARRFNLHTVAPIG